VNRRQRVPHFWTTATTINVTLLLCLRDYVYCQSYQPLSSVYLISHIIQCNTRSSAVADTTRRSLSFKFLLSHSMSFKIKPLSRACVSAYEHSIVIISLSWKWHHSIHDRRTNVRTHILPRHSPRYAYTSRDKNWVGHKITAGKERHINYKTAPQFQMNKTFHFEIVKHTTSRATVCLIKPRPDWEVDNALLHDE